VFAIRIILVLGKESKRKRRKNSASGEEVQLYFIGVGFNWLVLRFFLGGADCNSNALH